MNTKIEIKEEHNEVLDASKSLIDELTKFNEFLFFWGGLTMSKISIFPDNSGNTPIKGDKLESFLKEVRSSLVMEHISGNESASVQMTMTLAAACQKLFNELEELKSKPKRNCDAGNDWLIDFYCHFKPPKGMREMPPEWVDAITEFCRWLVSPLNSKIDG